MKNTLSARIKRSFWRSMLSLGLYDPLVNKVAGSVEVYGKANAEATHTLFALKPERFRGDLDILTRDFGFRVIKFKKGWQQKLLELFWPADFSLEHSYYYPEPGSREAQVQKRTRAFLKRFLPLLLHKLGVDCVLGAATYYLDDWDYSAVLDELRFPYVVIYRECFQASQKDIDFQVELAAKLRRFQGSHLIVHNEITRGAFIDCGYVSPQTVSAPGCMRMDPFIRKIESRTPPQRERKKITLFSFVHCIGVPQLCNDFTAERDKGFVKLFDEVHVAFFTFVKEHPEIDFVVKPKWAGTWVDEMQLPLTEQGIDIRKLQNLEILPDADAQDVILDSDVVIGFGSTVLLEAGIAGVPTIIPHFAECLDPYYNEYVLMQDYYDAFDIASSGEDMVRLMTERLDNGTVTEKAMQRRREAFERYVSPVSPHASEGYARIIRQAIEDAS